MYKIYKHISQKKTNNLMDLKDNSFQENKCLLQQHRLVFVVVYSEW